MVCTYLANLIAHYTAIGFFTMVNLLQAQAALFGCGF